MDLKILYSFIMYGILFFIFEKGRVISEAESKIRSPFLGILSLVSLFFFDLFFYFSCVFFLCFLFFFCFFCSFVCFLFFVCW